MCEKKNLQKFEHIGIEVSSNTGTCEVRARAADVSIATRVAYNGLPFGASLELWRTTVQYRVPIPWIRDPAVRTFCTYLRASGRRRAPK